jgi:hypothetical protein
MAIGVVLCVHCAPGSRRTFRFKSLLMMNHDGHKVAVRPGSLSSGILLAEIRQQHLYSVLIGKSPSRRFPF